MEAALPLNSVLLTAANHRRPLQPHNVRYEGVTAMSMLRGPIPRQLRSANISLIIIGSRFQPLRVANPSRDPVAESTRKGEEMEVALPPPPERPLPGDCCGSGCVRCVWDVYHEEFQAYKNLCEAENSKSRIKSKLVSSDFD